MLPFSILKECCKYWRWVSAARRGTTRDAVALVLCSGWVFPVVLHGEPGDAESKRCLPRRQEPDPAGEWPWPAFFPIFFIFFFFFF